VKPEKFDPNLFERGQKYAVDLELDPFVPGVSLPVLLVRGRTPGKTLVVTAGVHGDEYEGVRAILDAHAALNPDEMSGDFLAVPIANPPAFWAASRTSPLDGENLARLFPGSLDTGPTAAIAHFLCRSILTRADFYLDLHSAGVKLLMPTMAGYDARDARSQAAALVFGAKVLWSHSQVAPGRTISFAKSQGIPWIYTEARGAGRIHPDDLHIFTRGIRNLLCYLSILPGETRTYPVECHLYGDGNIDDSLASNLRGIFIPGVELLQKVVAGEQLGRTVSVHGETLEIFCAPRDGMVALIRQCLSVEPGDAVFLVTGTRN
jgi:predicted deacylase